MPLVMRTDRLHLRPAENGDAGSLLEVVTASMPELLQWLPWARRYDLSAAAAWCTAAAAGRDAGSRFQYSIFIDNGTLIGDVALFRKTDPVLGAEIGYWLGTRFAGNGYMTEVLRAIVVAGIAAGFDRMFVRVGVGNLPSRRVAEKCGFKFEPVARDSNVYGIFLPGRVRANKTCQRDEPLTW
jgi:RimJ/RimL family protein N-acetyltransferase